MISNCVLIVSGLDGRDWAFRPVPESIFLETWFQWLDGADFDATSTSVATKLAISWEGGAVTIFSGTRVQLGREAMTAEACSQRLGVQAVASGFADQVGPLALEDQSALIEDGDPIA